jgi:hypothetical protein
MTNDIPVTGKIKPRTQLSVPDVDSGTLVDDPVALVDDDTALVGGHTTIQPAMRFKIKVSDPRPRIKINR